MIGTNKTVLQREIPDKAAKPLSPQARRALAEAEARRQGLAQAELARGREVGGRGGPEPTRYGDWEKDGLAKDF